MQKTSRATRTWMGAAAVLLALGGCDSKPTATTAAAPAAQAAPPGSPGTALTRESLIALIEERDEFAKARKLGELLPTLGPDSIPVVKGVLDDAAVLELSAIEFELLLHYWAKHDPPGAAWYALSGTPRAYRVAAIYGAVTPWVRNNPEEALPTVRAFGIEPGDAGAAAQNAIVRGWYESGHPGLEDYIHSLGAGFDRQRALSAYANAMIRDKGGAALVKWAEAVPESDKGYKLDVYRRTALALVPHDVDAAKAFCEKYCEGEFGSNMRVRIADRWSRDDAEAALDWLASSPPSQDTSLGIRISFANWGAFHRPEAVAWMNRKIEESAEKQPPKWLEPTLPVYARLLAKDTPTEGLVWAERLKDPHDRRVMMVELAHDWYHNKDKTAAEAWLAQSSLDEEARAMVRSPETPAITLGAQQ